MTNVVANLRELGISYDVIGEVCGESYTNVSNYAMDAGDLPQSVIDKLRRAEAALNKCQNLNDDLTVGHVFESHIVLTETDDGKAWLYLYEMWGNGLISDEELTSFVQVIMNENQPLYRLYDMAMEFAGSATVAVEHIPHVHHAEPSEYMDFRKTLSTLPA